jgi:CheY-like chemotaxis protein
MAANSGSNCRAVEVAMKAPAAATLVIVDDNPDDIYFFTRALRKAGAAESVHSFENPKEALAFLAGADGENIRLLFLDIKMPVMSGFDVLEWVRAQPRLAAISIVMLSGSAAAADREKAMRLGASSYLVKPPAAEQIAALLRGNSSTDASDNEVPTRPGLGPTT